MIKTTTLALAILLPLSIGVTSSAAQIAACGPVAAPGTYTVTTDITAPADTNCLTISASGVAIDLGGHTISGSGFSSGIIDDGQSRANIIIANGTITGFNQNINMSVDYLSISNITVQNAGFSGISNAGSNTVVTDTQANHNGLYGMYFYGNNNLVYSTTANYNGQYGIAFEQQSATNTVSESIANGNGNYGIYFANGNSTVTNSNANENTTDDGIFVGGSNNQLTGNTTNGNGSNGISVVCPSNLYGNTAHDNPGGNIVTPGTGCVLLDNHAP